MRIHFVGIGGISMSALAKICINNGDIVSGSDFKDSASLDNLRSSGAQIFIGHSANNIAPDLDLVVYTAAISHDNPELVRAFTSNAEVIDRAKFLGRLMKGYNNSIGVSGTHGKTSTTSMISVIFNHADMDPTILVGGNLKSIDGNLRIGNSQNFITEACEYVDSFLQFNPKIATISNIEADHLDYFKDLEQIKTSFKNYASNVPDDGFVICNGDDKNIIDTLKDLDKNIITFGQNPNNKCLISNISFVGNGSRFTLCLDQKNLGEFEIMVPGLHNIYNATSAIVASLLSDISLDTIKSALTLYTGVDRRFQEKGVFNGVDIIDDYAHHPTEIKATLSSAKNICTGKLWCVFQPHTYTRTRTLLDDFSEAFFDASNVIILDIYAAREKDTGDIHSMDLVNRLKDKNVNTLYMNDFDMVCTYLMNNLNPNDMLITMGAGNVYEIGELILQRSISTNL